ncbi:hypothetical protein [Lapillicoccus jejuensis]|uniref:Uncharacterized protein n=1 Tax=Lapillicoccus jejuensis TaxID=402171 RepID=A0A542E2S4_9MICO|nr:hypothetical protein [Lapillicoccus jejuensis]TQJ09544.1 hypothetical protein FB458_2656 [Lapillicoccus jejuensis]
MTATPAAPPTRPPGPSPRLVTVVAVLVVAALAGLPAVGPETWVAVAGSTSLAPLALVARAGAGALGLVHAVAVALVALAVLRATAGSADPLRRVVALAVALVGCAAVPTGTRLLGLVLAAWTLVLWRRAARDPGSPGARAAGAAVLLVALWALLDPGWVLAPVLGLAVALGERADGRPDGARRVLAATGGALLVGVVAAGALLLRARDGAATLSTWGGALWSGPVPGGTGPRPVTDPLVLLVVVPLVLVIGSWLRSGRTPDRSTPVLAGLALLLALGPAGTSPAAGLVAAVVVATALGGRSPSTTAASAAPGALVVGVALLLAAVPAWVTSASAAAQDPVARLGPALTALPPGTPVLADPRLGPRVRAGAAATVADVPSGRLLAALRAEPGWREVVAGSGAQAALLTDEAPLLAALQERLGWRVVARSGPVVLLRAAPAR